MAEVTEEQAPRKARELFDKGFAAMERGNVDYAIDLLLSALDLEPRFLKARRYLRATEVRKFNETKGNAVTHAIATLSGLGTLLGAMGSVKKSPQKALRMAENLMRKDPLNMPFINVLGQAAVAADMPEVAIQTLEVAKEYYPKNIKVIEWLGNLYLDTDQTQKARDCFEKIMDLKPNDPKAIKALKDATALDTLQKGKWDTAESYRDVMKDEKGATLLEQQSKAVKSQKDVGDLIAETKRKIQQEPQNVNYQRALADLYVRAKQYDEALEILRTAQAASGGADPQIDLAISSVHIKQFDEVIARLQAEGNTAAAEAKEKEKQSFQFEDAKARVKRYPNDLQFRYELGVILFGQGVLNEAIQQFQLSQRNPHRRIRSLYYLARCFKQKQQYDIAMEQLDKAASEINSMDDTKKDIYYEMGSLCEVMGQAKKASEYYKEIYAVDISYKDVADKIDKAYGDQDEPGNEPKDDDPDKATT